MRKSNNFATSLNTTSMESCFGMPTFYIGFCQYQLHQYGSYYPMDTSSLIRRGFDFEIPCGKFVEITSILKAEFTWKLWHRFDVEILTWTPLSKSTKYRWVLHVDFSTLFRCRIDVISVLAVCIVLSPGTYGKLFWYSVDSMWFQQCLRNHWYWNYWNYMFWKLLQQRK